MNKQSFVQEFSLAADNKKGELRIISHEVKDTATFVHDSLRGFLESHAEIVYGMEICGDIESPTDNTPHEDDKRKFRITTTIEEIS